MTNCVGTLPTSSQPTTSVAGSRPSKVSPYEVICKAWASHPERFTLNPLQQKPGLNT